jgi:hypothetical protein
MEAYMENVEYIELNKCRFYAEAEGEIVGSLDAEFKSNENYLNLKEKQNSLYKNLCSSVTDENIRLLVDYCDIQHQILVLMQSFFYRRGFVDGARLIQSIWGSREINCVFKLGDI